MVCWVWLFVWSGEPGASDVLAWRVCWLAELPSPASALWRLLLPGGTTLLQIRGAVEYSQECRCGVNFLNLSAEERKQIQRFVQSAS